MTASSPIYSSLGGVPDWYVAKAGLDEEQAEEFGMPAIHVGDACDCDDVHLMKVDDIGEMVVPTERVYRVSRPPQLDLRYGDTLVVDPDSGIFGRLVVIDAKEHGPARLSVRFATSDAKILQRETQWLHDHVTAVIRDGVERTTPREFETQAADQSLVEWVAAEVAANQSRKHRDGNKRYRLLTAPTVWMRDTKGMNDTEIGRVLGVSDTTVRRVLANYEHVRDERYRKTRALSLLDSGYSYEEIAVLLGVRHHEVADLIKEQRADSDEAKADENEGTE